MRNRMIWMAVLVVMAGTFFLSSCSCKGDPTKEQKKNVIAERQKALKEVTDFVDKQGR